MTDYETTIYKGYISCPFCDSKTFVEKGTHGRTISQCKCKHFLILDYDRMTATPTKPIRGLTRHFQSAS